MTAIGLEAGETLTCQDFIVSIDAHEAASQLSRFCAQCSCSLATTHNFQSL